MEKTFSIIKPNAMKKNLIGKIIQRFEEENLQIAAGKIIHLSKDQAEKFYAEHSERPFFNDLVKFMTSHPIMVMVLKGENAVERNREIMGATNPAEAAPNTLRKLYGDSIEENAVHGSDSPKSAQREISLFFNENEIF